MVCETTYYNGGNGYQKWHHEVEVSNHMWSHWKGHSHRLLWHAHQCGHSKGRSMWRVTSNVSGLVATQIWASTDETLLPWGSRPCFCHQGGMAVHVFLLSSLSLWTVFELTNDVRTCKIRARSDLDVIRTSTRTYGTYVRYKFFFSALLAHACPNKLQGQFVWTSGNHNHIMGAMGVLWIAVNLEIQGRKCCALGELLTKLWSAMQVH